VAVHAAIFRLVAERGIDATNDAAHAGLLAHDGEMPIARRKVSFPVEAMS
jgi:hypothetical protein